MFTHFTQAQLLPFWPSVFCLLTAILLFPKKEKPALAFLFLGSLGIGFFIAHLDPFLILWDEQFHALVAKNMTQDFLKPTLYANPLLEYQFKNWASNHIWLHKQPLFLWQMALSIKLLGTQVMAVRLPSVIMHAIIPIFIFRIGKISLNKEIGFYAAVFFALAYYPLELVAGRYSTDHNDIAFLFYVTASFWAWFEYEKTGRKYWLVLIGIFSGGAVLVKWLMGLLVFVIWGIVLLFHKPIREFNWRLFIPIVQSGLISLIVFLPWQIFIHTAYPVEAAHEMLYNALHFTQAVEGHGGPFNFHFTEGLRTLYGSGFMVPFFILAGLILLTLRIPQRKFKIAITGTVVFVYVFYSIASTKMFSFTLIVSPFIFLGLGSLVHTTIQFVQTRLLVSIPKWHRVLAPILLLIIGFSGLNWTKIKRNHTDWKPYDNFDRHLEMNEMAFIQSLQDHFAGDSLVVFNANITLLGNIPVMFFTDLIAYDFVPSREHISKVRNQGWSVAVLETEELPGYILEDSTIIRLTPPAQRNPKHTYKHYEYSGSEVD